jgi:hypothetical protein
MIAMAERKHTSTSPKRASRAVTASKAGRYPQWKLDLFKAGMYERRQSTSGSMSGRATRAPGA